MLRQSLSRMFCIAALVSAASCAPVRQKAKPVVQVEPPAPPSVLATPVGEREALVHVSCFTDDGEEETMARKMAFHFEAGGKVEVAAVDERSVPRKVSGDSCTFQPVYAQPYSDNTARVFKREGEPFYLGCADGVLTAAHRFATVQPVSKHVAKRVGNVRLIKGSTVMARGTPDGDLVVKQVLPKDGPRFCAVSVEKEAMLITPVTLQLPSPAR